MEEQGHGGGGRWRLEADKLNNLLDPPDPSPSFPFPTTLPPSPSLSTTFLFPFYLFDFLFSFFAFYLILGICPLHTHIWGGRWEQSDKDGGSDRALLSLP